jgi:hypothetical protein
MSHDAHTCVWGGVGGWWGGVVTSLVPFSSVFTVENLMGLPAILVIPAAGGEVLSMRKGWCESPVVIQVRHNSLFKFLNISLIHVDCFSD